MALTYTAASKGQATGVSATITSDAFSSAIGDFITVICIGGDSAVVPPALVTNNNTAVTWTQRALQNVASNCAVAMYSGTVASGTPPTTVSALFTGGAPTGSKWIAVMVHTGAHATTPLPAGNIFSGSGGTDVSQVITPTSVGSALWMGTGDWGQTNSYAAIANCTLGTVYDEASQQTDVFIRPTTQPRTDAAAFTIGETDTAGKITWVAFEVQAAASNANVGTSLGATFHPGKSPGKAPMSARFWTPQIWPGVVVGGGASVTPSTLALVLTTFAAVVSVTANVVVTPAPATLTLTRFAPTVTASDHKTVTPTTKALTLATFAPTVSVSDNKVVTPTTAVLVTSKFAPTITVTANQTVTPSTAALSITTFAPTVTGGAGLTVTPGTASLTTARFAPTVTASNHQTVTPSTASLVISTFAPTVTATGAEVVTTGGGLPEFAYRGGVTIPAQLKVEPEAEKLARRIREGTLPAPTLPAVSQDTAADLSAYYQQSERLAAKIAASRLEAEQLRQRIARLEADALAAKLAKRAAIEHRLLIAQQQLILLAAQEAMLLEEIESIDVAFFACIALAVVLN